MQYAYTFFNQAARQVVGLKTGLEIEMARWRGRTRIHSSTHFRVRIRVQFSLARHELLCNKIAYFQQILEQTLPPRRR